jgi:hypothetical protein
MPQNYNILLYYVFFIFIFFNFVKIKKSLQSFDNDFFKNYGRWSIQDTSLRLFIIDLLIL